MEVKLNSLNFRMKMLSRLSTLRLVRLAIVKRQQQQQQQQLKNYNNNN